MTHSHWPGLAREWGMRPRHTGECPQPRSLPGVSCRANITHHHHQVILLIHHNIQSHKHTVRYQGFRVSLDSRWSISLHEIGVTPNKVLMLPTLCRSPGSLTQVSHQNLSDRMEICSPPVLSINLDPEPNKKFVWTLLNCLGVGGQRGMMFYHSRTGNQFYGLFVFLFRCSFVAFLPTPSSAGLGRARQDPVGWLGRVGFLDGDKNLIVSVHIIRRFVQIIK